MKLVLRIFFFSCSCSLCALCSSLAELPALFPEQSKPQLSILCASPARRLKPQFSAIIADSKSVSFHSPSNRKQRVFKAERHPPCCSPAPPLSCSPLQVPHHRGREQPTKDVSKPPPVHPDGSGDFLGKASWE